MGRSTDFVAPINNEKNTLFYIIYKYTIFPFHTSVQERRSIHDSRKQGLRMEETHRSEKQPWKPPQKVLQHVEKRGTGIKMDMT